MAKFTIIEGNSNDKDNVRSYMVKGEKGYSAYDIAVQNGYTGTEEEWLDEFLNADNFYNKSETDALLDDKADTTDLANYKLNGDFAVVTESLTILEDASTGSVNINLPSGFTATNTYVISYSYKSSITTLKVYSPVMGVSLIDNSGSRLYVTMILDNPVPYDTTYDVEILLMKL